MKFVLETPNIPLFNVAKAQKLFATDITKTLDTMMNKTVNNLMFTAPTGATNQLRNSIDSERIGKMAGRVFVGVNYGVIIEKGRRPAPVASSAIPGLIRWLRSSKKGRTYYASLQQRYKKMSYKSAAYALAAKLKKYGFKKNPFFDRGVKRTRKVYRNESKYLLAKIARGLVKL